MLEAMRQNSRSAIIYILFGILIAAFVISFGPGSGSGSGSFGGLEKYAAKVDGSEISENDFHFAYVALGAANLPGNTAREQRVKEFIMDRLVERELLAREGERLGLAASEKEAAEMVADGRILVIGMPRRVEGYAFKEGKFDYERFRMVAQNHYRVTVKELMEIQQRELLADKVREVLRTGTHVSEEEVKLDFEQKGLQVNLEYLRVSPRRYQKTLDITDEEAEAWARAHEDEIKKAYEAQKFFFERQSKTAHVRRIVLELDKKATDEQVKAAEAKLEAMKKTILSGTKFADVARTESQDALTRGRGGDAGWLKQGYSSMGEEADTKMFKAKEGDIIGPLRTDKGVALVKIEGFREGDISLQQARAELALNLAMKDKQQSRAKAEAAEIMKKVSAGGKLAELFPKPNSDADEAKPKGADDAPPQVEETGLFARNGFMIQGVGNSRELTKAAFKTAKVGETVGPFELADGYVIATLKERKEPDMADWEKRKSEIIDEYKRTKAAEVMQAWNRRRCVEVKAASRIKVNPETLAYEGGGPPAKYEPCTPPPRPM